MGSKLTTDEFIIKASVVHGDRYDYSHVEYVNDRTKVLIYCGDHGSFLQSPGHHIRRKHGCPDCRGDNISSTSIKNAALNFVSKARGVHGNRYDYSKAKYVSAIDKVNIICSEHGTFKQSPNVHLGGSGCSKCGFDSISKYHFDSEEDFIKKANIIHKNHYDYSNVKYISSKIKVSIICKDGHKFMQKPSDHLSGRGCPHCRRKNEWETGEILKKVFDGWIIDSQKKIWLSFKKYSKPRYCDFWLEKDGVKVMVEYDGEQHFRPVTFYSMSKEKANKKFQQRMMVDRLDKEFCKENGIVLCRIKYNEDKTKVIMKLKNEVNNLWN